MCMAGVNKMNDFRSRLIDETRVLNDKLIKLRTFNNSKRIRDLSTKQQALLREQEKVMHRYHEILETRLAST